MRYRRDVEQGGKRLYTGPSVRWRRELPGTVVCVRDAFFNVRSSCALPDTEQEPDIVANSFLCGGYRIHLPQKLGN